jgi:hypothetical protein
MNTTRTRKKCTVDTAKLLKRTASLAAPSLTEVIMTGDEAKIRWLIATLVGCNQSERHSNRSQPDGRGCGVSAARAAGEFDPHDRSTRRNEFVRELQVSALPRDFGSSP